MCRSTTMADAEAPAASSAGPERATVRPDAEMLGARPSATSVQPFALTPEHWIPVFASSQAMSSTRMTVAGSGGAMPSKLNRGWSVTHAMVLPSADTVGSAIVPERNSTM